MIKAKHLSLIVLLLVCVAFSATGCKKVAPVANPSSAMPITGNVSEKDIRSAIITAGAIKNWEIVPTGPKTFEGRLSSRAHVAVVEITYDEKNYSILYKDSVNLQYADGSIHPNYNRWVLALENEIRRQLAALNRK